MAVTVFAVPDVLGRFDVASGDGADDLARRAAALDHAVGSYLRVTERAYEAPCASAPAAVRAYADALRRLGGWVGRVGQAFVDGALLGGRRVTTLERLAAALPAGFHLGAGLPGAGALAAAEAVAGGAHPRDLVAIGHVFGSRSPGAARVAEVAAGQAGQAIGRYIDWGAAVARGAAESEARWHAEAHLDLPERLGRAALDGIIAGAGAFGGSAAGAAGAGYACSPLGPAVQAVCASAGSRAGNAVGGALAEGVSDLILGPEVVVHPRVIDTSAVVAGSVETTGALAGREADLRADFVLERPWLWDDEFADAPAAANPAAADPPAPAAGPR